MANNAEEGTPGNPVVGLPRAVSPFLFDASHAEGLIGSEFQSQWFRLLEEQRAAFHHSISLDDFYADLSADSVIEGLYLLSLVDPLVSGMMRDPERHQANLMYGLDRVRFTSRVYIKDALSLKCRIGKVDRRQTGVVLGLDCELLVAGSDRPGMTANLLAFYPVATI